MERRTCSWQVSEVVLGFFKLDRERSELSLRLVHEAFYLLHSQFYFLWLHLNVASGCCFWVLLLGVASGCCLLLGR